MTQTITTSTATSVAIPAHRVWLRQFWGDNWELEPYLYCETCAKRASPEKSSAILHYDYGTIVRPDSNEAVYFAPLAIERWYVKIEIDAVDSSGNPETILWYGIVVEPSKEAYGAPLSGSSARLATGIQKFTCYGMEDLLAREVPLKSWFLNDAFEEIAVNRPLPFNFQSSHTADHVVPNRASVVGRQGALKPSYLFYGGATNTAQAWSSDEIVDYLLAYESPKNPLGLPIVPFAVDPDYDAVPYYDQPRIERKTESLKELIDRLISRKRLVSYWVDVNESEEENGEDIVLLRCFTFTAADIVVPTSYPAATGTFTNGFAVISANAATVSLDFDEAFDVECASLRYSGHDRYDQVVVRGARKTSTFSTGWLDDNLSPGWDVGTLQTEYQTAASGQSNYGPTAALQQYRNQLWRDAERYRKVYRWFSVDADWNGEANNGEGTGAWVPVFVIDDSFGADDTWFRPGLLFRSKLPFYAGWDYTQLPSITPDSQYTGSGLPPELLGPLAFFKCSTTLADNQTRYMRADKMVEAFKTDKHSLAGPAISCSLKMQDRGLGVELNVHGAPQHAIAKSTFSPVDFSDLQSPPLDYTNNVIFTVCVEADSFCEATQPEDVALQPDVDPEAESEEAGDEVGADPAEDPQVDDSVRTLLIDLSHLEHGNALRLDFVCTGTVVDISDGLLKRVNAGCYVRDDRGRLGGLAKAAWAWYSVARQAFTLRYRQIDGQFSIGQLITQLGSGATLEEVNTPITSIEWDLVAGTTTITTGFAELDFGNFL